MKKLTSENLAKIFKKAAQDSAFKKKLLENPNAAFKEFNISLPEGLNVKFLENTKDTYYFVMPECDNEATEEELKKITGGQLGGSGNTGS